MKTKSQSHFPAWWAYSAFLPRGDFLILAGADLDVAAFFLAMTFLFARMEEEKKKALFLLSVLALKMWCTEDLVTEFTFELHFLS